MNESKYCPLLMARYGKPAVETECIKEKCAWYVLFNSGSSGCAALEIVEACCNLLFGYPEISETLKRLG